MEELRTRPRSNPHSRTPRRYESPLNSNEFRREIITTTNTSTTNTITPVYEGTVTTTTQTTAGGRSSKQDLPSHRKVRRWNNDHFVNLADELQASSNAATVLRLAAKDAHLYRSVYDPKDHQPSEDVQKFLYGPQQKHLRELFFDGSIGGIQDTTVTAQTKVVKRREGNERIRNNPTNRQDCMNRMDPRLRRIMQRACTNSFPAAIVTSHFEQFLLRAYTVAERKKRSAQNQQQKELNLPKNWWEDILLECPTVTERTDGKFVAQFYFRESSVTANNNNNNNDNHVTGGFHRLLLHGITQFHGLQAVSRMIEYTGVASPDNTTTTGASRHDGTSISARALIVTGHPFADINYTFRFIEEDPKGDSTIIINDNNSHQISSPPEKEDWVHIGVVDC